MSISGPASLKSTHNPIEADGEDSSEPHEVSDFPMRRGKFMIDLTEDNTRKKHVVPYLSSPETGKERYSELSSASTETVVSIPATLDTTMRSNAEIIKQLLKIGRDVEEMKKDLKKIKGIVEHLNGKYLRKTKSTKGASLSPKVPPLAKSPPVVDFTPSHIDSNFKEFKSNGTTYFAIKRFEKLTNESHAIVDSATPTFSGGTSYRGDITDDVMEYRKLANLTVAAAHEIFNPANSENDLDTFSQRRNYHHNAALKIFPVAGRNRSTTNEKVPKMDSENQTDDHRNESNLEHSLLHRRNTSLTDQPFKVVSLIGLEPLIADAGSSGTTKKEKIDDNIHIGPVIVSVTETNRPFTSTRYTARSHTTFESVDSETSKIPQIKVPEHGVVDIELIKISKLLGSKLSPFSTSGSLLDGDTTSEMTPLPAPPELVTFSSPPPTLIKLHRRINRPTKSPSQFSTSVGLSNGNTVTAVSILQASTTAIVSPLQSISRTAAGVPIILSETNDVVPETRMSGKMNMNSATHAHTQSATPWRKKSEGTEYIKSGDERIYYQSLLWPRLLLREIQ